jgi:hypothetical protein
MMSRSPTPEMSTPATISLIRCHCAQQSRRVGDRPVTRASATGRPATETSAPTSPALLRRARVGGRAPLGCSGPGDAAMRPCSPIVPFFETADLDATACTTGAGVRSHERPAVLGVLALHKEVVHEHLHVRERNHERSRSLCDGGSPDFRSSVVDGERAVGSVVLERVPRFSQRDVR